MDLSAAVLEYNRLRDAMAENVEERATRELEFVYFITTNEYRADQTCVGFIINKLFTSHVKADAMLQTILPRLRCCAPKIRYCPPWGLIDGLNLMMLTTPDSELNWVCPVPGQTWPTKMTAKEGVAAKLYFDHNGIIGNTGEWPTLITFWKGTAIRFYSGDKLSESTIYY